MFSWLNRLFLHRGHTQMWCYVGHHAYWHRNGDPVLSVCEQHRDDWS